MLILVVLAAPAAALTYWAMAQSATAKIERRRQRLAMPASRPYPGVDHHPLPQKR